MADTARPAETREMRLVSKLIEQSKAVKDKALVDFLARRRHPAMQLSWDQVSFQLAAVIGEIVTDGTLRKWASVYGIPDGGRNIVLTTDEYERGLKAASITIYTPR